MSVCITSQDSAVTAPPASTLALAADGSTFAPAMALLPARARADVESLYRVLRTLDDLVDNDDPRASERVQAVERWAGGDAGGPAGGWAGGSMSNVADARAADTDAGRAAETGDAPDTRAAETDEARALAQLARTHPLSRGSLLEFCAGMRHDIVRATVETDEDFMRYCQQAGGSVGVVLADILGTTSQEGQERMATLGRAMQVTNILRDIDEDRAHGRVYISRSAIERFGEPAPGAREALLRDHIARADVLYEEGIQAIGLLREGRRAMALAAVLYREILREIEREGYGSRPGRVVVAPWRRRLLAARLRVATR